MNDTTRDWTADHVHAHFHAKGWGRPPGPGVRGHRARLGGGGRRRMRRGDIRRADPVGPRRGPGPRLRDHAPARGAQRRHLAAEPRFGLPDAADARGRGARSAPPRRRRHADLRADRDRTRRGRGRGQRPARRGRPWERRRRRAAARPAPRGSASHGGRPPDRRRPARPSRSSGPPRSSAPARSSTGCSPRTEGTAAPPLGGSDPIVTRRPS